MYLPDISSKSALKAIFLKENGLMFVEKVIFDDSF
jgi:hypothetical protein